MRCPTCDAVEEHGGHETWCLDAKAVDKHTFKASLLIEESSIPKNLYYVYIHISEGNDFRSLGDMDNTIGALEQFLAILKEERGNK